MTITRHAVGASMVLPTFYAPVSSVPLFADDFYGGVSAWQQSMPGTVFTAVSGEMRSAWTWDGVNPKFGSVAHLMPSVMVPGRVYLLTATARADTPAQVRLGFGNSVGGTTGTLISGGGWEPVSSTPRVLNLLMQSAVTAMNPLLDQGTPGLTGTTSTVYWDNVAVYEMTAQTTLDLHPERAQITLDESWSPYARATITCPLPPTDALAKIDPRVMNRVQMVLSQTDVDSRTVAYLTTLFAGKTAAWLTTIYAGKTAAWLTDQFGDYYNATVSPARNQRRTADMMLRTRTLDYVAGTMTLELTSDEMVLQDFCRPESITTTFTPPFTYSLRDLVAWGLGFVNAALAIPSSDAVIDPSAAIWNVGEQLWSFLDTFIRSAGMRLWCDEQRFWHLTPPLTGASGTANLTDVVALGDTLTRDDPGYGDATVIVYEWTDAAGINHSSYGNYYLPTMQYPKMFVQRFNNPDTGVTGSPASVLRDRTITRGRSLDVQAVSDYGVTPGQAVSVVTPVTTVSGAMVSAVTWSWPDDEMAIRTRDAT